MIELNEKQKSILRVIEENLQVTPAKLSEISGLQDRDIRRQVAELIKHGYIAVSGKTSNRSFKRIYNTELINKEIVVFEDGKKVGIILYGNGQYKFTYHNDYKGGLNGIPRDGENVSTELFNIFENLIPEHDRRDRLLSKSDDLVDALLLIKNSHGSFEFVKTEELFKFKSNYTDRPSWISVKSKILDHNDYPNLLDYKVDIDDAILDNKSQKEYSNLSGYQTKVDVSINKKLKTITLADGEADYLLKPRNIGKMSYFGDEGYYPLLGLNEHLYMTFAKNELGFDVPYTAIIESRERNEFHYLVKRYDRFNNFKYGQKDFAQIMNIPSKNKYRPSNEDLMVEISKTLTSKDSKLDALAFYYYGYLIKHADLHTKNIGTLLVTAKHKVLTPLYDVISVGLYKGRDGDDLGLKSKSQPRSRGFKLSDFKKWSEILEIPWREFEVRARFITIAYLEKMPMYIEKTRVFENKHGLEYQISRQRKTTFSARMENMFKERIIDLKKNGILEELGLLELAGGPLKASLREERSKK